ncbi:MAG: tRNA (N6-threonylcarbamoyladenosine(37)-N6)-methyltransferase TrmO [Candidatus Omnitrophota bacterium]|jgi:tRNA-Thr(GGU) m(6)t(6)A37 methyltransferase TsaA
MKKEIRLKPIGIIHTPYKDSKGMPIQGKFGKDVKGRIEIFLQYKQGLKNIEGFSHLILIYYFNQSKEEKLIARSFLEDVEHGIFSMRSPHRPNHIGFSIVKFEKVKNNIVLFSEVDMLDGTPLLDIKPYASHFDSRKQVKNGWIEKHFRNCEIPQRTKIGC